MIKIIFTIIMFDLSILGKLSNTIATFDIKNSEYYDMITRKTWKNISIMGLLATLLFAVYYIINLTIESEKNLSSILFDPINKETLSDIMKIITFIILVYESFRDNDLSYYTMYVFTIAVGAMIEFNDSNYSTIISFAIYLSIIFFMTIHCYEQDSDFLCVLIFIEVFLFILYIIEYEYKADNKKVDREDKENQTEGVSLKTLPYKQHIMIYSFILFYMWLHKISC